MKDRIVDVIKKNAGKGIQPVAVKLRNLFETEKKKYGLQMCQQTISGLKQVDPLMPYDQFIPAELGGENEKS